MKPSEITPMTATVLAQICTDAGVPDGVVNMVHGKGETGAAITSHEDVMLLRLRVKQPLVLPLWKPPHQQSRNYLSN